MGRFCGGDQMLPPSVLMENTRSLLVSSGFLEDIGALAHHHHDVWVADVVRNVVDAHPLGPRR